MVIVEEIIPLRTGVHLRLDSGRCVRLTRKEIAEGGFREGMELNEADFDQFVRLHQYPRALNQAVSMLARRPCSRYEIERRLTDNRFEAEIVGLVLYKLEKERLLNDAEFADNWTQYRSAGKFGRRRIQQELKQKGVDDEIALDALNRLDENELLENAVRLALKAIDRSRPSESRYSMRNRVLSALVRKGYDWEMASKAFETASKQANEMHDP